MLGVWRKVSSRELREGGESHVEVGTKTLMYRGVSAISNRSDFDEHQIAYILPHLKITSKQFRAN